MSLLQHSYVTELELLITDVLLPAYEKYQLSKGNKTPFKDINPKLLAQVTKTKRLPALLRPFENLS